MLLWLMACTTAQDTGEAPPQWVFVIDAAAWTEVLDAAEDPFDDRPQTVECSALGYGVESSYFEVRTEDCPYGTFQQPLLADVPEGAELQIKFWHLDLWAPKPAQGHFALRTADVTLFDTYIDIPSGSGVYAVDFTAPAPLKSGESVFFHVHNHGYNSWTLGSLEAYISPP